MRNGLRIAIACLTSLSLFSCASSGGSKDSVSSEGMTSSVDEKDSESLVPDARWGNELLSLMDGYCPSPLPYPENLIGESLRFDEAEDEDGSLMLKIYDGGKKFTLGKYYESLVDDGWEAILGYNKKIKRQADDYEFYELTKGVGLVGYNISYTFEPAEGDYLGGNVIYCRCNGSTRTTSQTDWSDKEKETIRLATTVSLPFMAFGDDYEVQRQSEDTVIIRDHSIYDLCADYGEVLEEAGFNFSLPLSKVYDFLIFETYYDDKIIFIGLSYNNGNHFKIDFAARPAKTDHWPSSALSEIEAKAGLTIPQFKADGLVYYYSYEKNDKVYVYAETPVAIEKDTDYLTKLAKAGFVETSENHYRNAEKKVNLDTVVLTNESLGQIERYGFQIIVYMD